MDEEKKARNVKILEMRETMSVPQIAQELGIGRQRVYQLMRRLNLRGRNGIAIEKYMSIRKQELKDMKEAWITRLGKDQRYMDIEDWRKLELNLQAESAKARVE
jgi:transposase